MRHNNKIKLSLASLLVMGLSSTCVLISANARDHDNDDFDGIYMGIAAGGLATLSEFKNNPTLALYDTLGNEFFSGFLGDDSNNTLDAKQYDISGTGEIRLGYGKSIADWPIWLGLEIFGNLGDRDVTDSEQFNTLLEVEDPEEIIVNTDFSNKTTVSLNDAEFGIDLRPGIFLSEDTLLYGRIGAAFNELELSTHTIFDNEFIGEIDDSFTSSVHAKNSDNVTALRLGVGLEQKILSQLSVTFDYIYTDYGDISAHNTNFQPVESGNSSETTISSNAAVKTHAVLLGINYFPDFDF